LITRLFPHIPQFLVAWGVFVACGLVYYVILLVRSGARFHLKSLYHQIIPFDVRSERSFHADMKVYAIDSFTGVLFSAPGLLLTGAIGLAVYRRMSDLVALPTTSFPLVAAPACAMIMFVLAELSDWFFHYLEHKVPELWELHKLHHAVELLNPFTARRLHPVSLILNGLARGLISGVPAGLLMFIFGITIAEILALSLVASKIFSVTSLNPLKHSHHPISFGPFDRLLISPHMHQAHHSRLDAHIDKNFGTNLAVFDWLFGTAHQPQPGELIEFGLSGYDSTHLEEYFSLRGAYLQPLIKSAALFQRRMASRRYSRS
jgi:sterol desaturase/sphingolipid hydroxylase (fatty acid hydroxylase superfamily)